MGKEEGEPVRLAHNPAYQAAILVLAVGIAVAAFLMSFINTVVLFYFAQSMTTPR